MRLKTTSIIGLMLVSLVGCSSSTLYQKVLHVPSWILSPDVEDGLAISQCVPWTGDYNSNKTLASEKSITATQQHLSARVEKINASWNTNDDQQAIRAVVDSGKVIRVDFATMDDKEQLCTLWFVEDDKLSGMLETTMTRHSVVISKQQVNDYLQVIKSK